ncbi:helix-turn-helix domain-containing protein [Rhodobacteraceae bacterium ASV31]|nr:helix-turn-helix domain-containing protein [Anianabacter salinae]
MEGLGFREIGRLCGCEASTVLRSVRRIEQLRDDPVCDALLDRLSRARRQNMPAKPAHSTDLPDKTTLEAEAARVLPRMAEPGACLAIAPGLDTSVIVREMPDGRTIRVASVARPVAEAFVLKGWVEGRGGSKVARYRLAPEGRAFLRTCRAAHGMSEAPALFERAGAVQAGVSPSDTPLAALARRRQADGTPFLNGDLVAAGERLREDFEIAQMGDIAVQNWDRFVTGRLDGGALASERRFGPEAARARIASALGDLGPGLGDVALRCCCYLEGLEQAERRLGWSARSGKVVLRIALERLRRHYAELGETAALIG